MADIHCPMTKEIRPMSGCITCEKHVKDGTSIEWCGYRPPPQPAKKQTEIPINALEMQVRKKLGKAEYFYKTGKTRIAENLSHEAARLTFEIRRRKKNDAG